MQTITILFISLILSTTTYGQITTTKVANKSVDNSSIKFDSLTNFLGKNVYQYLGQELYLKGKSESLRKYGYDGFYTDYNKSKFDNGVYKCCDSYNSKYSELEGKYFTVLEIIKHPKADENEYLYGKKFYLKLKEKLSQDIMYFEYDTDFEHSFPFIVVGFLEKLKKQAIGQKFVFGSTKLRFGEDELDVKTGKPIIFKLGEKWECFDVTIEEQYYNLSLLLKDKLGQTLSIGYEMAIGSEKFYDVYTEKEAERYKTKFGLDNWTTILQGKVSIGMTKEMCKLSWGEPKDINETITSGRKSEQWVYADNYLYFDNGKLTTIQ
jgi:hypothetical protein